MKDEINYGNNNCLGRFKDFCKSYYTNKGSAKNRISSAKKFITFINMKQRKIGEVNYETIDEFFEYELENGTSLITISSYYSYLKGFFVFLKERQDNAVMDYSKVKIERIKKINFEVFNNDQIKELFNIINAEKNIRLKLSNRILFGIMFYTGCTLSEVDSINVYEKLSDMPYDDDNYIILKSKELYFRNPNIRKFKLHDQLAQDIIQYHGLIAKKIGKEKIPNGASLFLTTYAKTQELGKFSYASLQSRINSIKKKSSFSDKKLSLKNIRHTLIKKLIESEKSLEFISESVGIDLSTLKIYVNDNNNIENEILDFFYNKHPYKAVII